MSKFQLSRDRMLGIVVLVIAAVFGYNSTLTRTSRIQGDPGPVLFPMLICIILGICGITLLAMGKADENRKPFLNGAEKKRLLILYGIYILMYFLLQYAGYMIAIPLVLLVIAWLFGRASKVPLMKTVIYTAGVSIGLYLIYVVLMGSNLPRGVLF